MIRTEAEWIRQKLLELHPITTLNCGASDERFRTVEQPWIAEAFQGFHVLHLDQKPHPGVQLVCDLERDALAQVCPTPYPLVLLTSVLEHVEDRNAVLRNLLAVATRWLIVTVPHQWTYHPDPIDTLYRPTLEELVAEVRAYGFSCAESRYLSDPRGVCAAGLFLRHSS